MISSHEHVLAREGGLLVLHHRNEVAQSWRVGLDMVRKGFAELPPSDDPVSRDVETMGENVKCGCLLPRISTRIRSTSSACTASCKSPVCFSLAVRFSRPNCDWTNSHRVKAKSDEVPRFQTLSRRRRSWGAPSMIYHPGVWGASRSELRGVPDNNSLLDRLTTVVICGKGNHSPLSRSRVVAPPCRGPGREERKGNYAGHSRRSSKNSLLQL